MKPGAFVALLRTVDGSEDPEVLEYHTSLLYGTFRKLVYLILGSL